MLWLRRLLKIRVAEALEIFPPAILDWVNQFSVTVRVPVERHWTMVGGCICNRQPHKKQQGACRNITDGTATTLTV